MYCTFVLDLYMRFVYPGLYIRLEYWTCVSDLCIRCMYQRCTFQTSLFLLPYHRKTKPTQISLLYIQIGKINYKHLCAFRIEMYFFTFTECEPGTYGANCGQVCECKEAISCDRVTGRCVCKPGYHGDRCDQGMALSTSRAESSRNEHLHVFFDMCKLANVIIIN